MGLILPILLLGLMASLSPSTVVVFILLLDTTRAHVNAVAFLFGWALSLTIVFVASFGLGASDTVQDSGAHRAAEIAEILLGLALVAAATHQWRRQRSGVAPPTLPGRGARLTARLRNLRPWGAVLVGVLKQPWAITAAAALVVVHHHPAPVVAAVSFLVFTVVSTATVAWIFAYYALRPGRAEAGLSALRERVGRTGPRLFPVAALAAGLVLLLDGIAGLAGLVGG